MLIRPETELMLMTRPFRRRRIAGSTVRVTADTLDLYAKPDGSGHRPIP
jgi:hypothetical protein